VLEAIGNQIQENARLDRWKAVMIATASGNGIGKSALLAWIIIWALVTFEDTMGVVTAGSESQLRTRLWSELSKWHMRLPDDLRAQFELTATALFNRQSERTWRVDGRPWTERNKEAANHDLGRPPLAGVEQFILPDCYILAGSWPAPIPLPRRSNWASENGLGKVLGWAQIKHNLDSERG
jgi:hypothetical protein